MKQHRWINRKGSKYGKTAAGRHRAFFRPQGHGFFNRALEAGQTGQTTIGPVQLRTDSKAAQLADAVNAQAFTLGQQVFFGTGAFNPHTRAGLHLIAHELAHTQQPVPAHHIMRKPKADNEEPDWGKMGSRVQKKFWDDLNTFFPGSGYKLGGSGFDRQQDAPLSITLEYKEVKVKGGTYTSGPLCMMVGKKYWKEDDAKLRAAWIKAELQKADDYRFTNHMLIAEDLPDVEAKLKGMSLHDRLAYEAGLKAYATKTKVDNQPVLQYLLHLRFSNYELEDNDLAAPGITKMLEELNPQQWQVWRKQAADYGKASKRSVTALDTLLTSLLQKASLQVISTPLPDADNLQTNALGLVEKMVIPVGPNVEIEVLPDGVSSNIKSSGETSITNNLPKSYYYIPDKAGVVTELYENKSKKNAIALPSKIVFTIQTNYQPGVNKLSPSAYGIGTTKNSSTNPTLQYHEGAHGTDFITAIRGFSFPPNLAVGSITATELKGLYSFINGLGAMTERNIDEQGYKRSEYLKDQKKKK